MAQDLPADRDSFRSQAASALVKRMLKSSGLGRASRGRAPNQTVFSSNRAYPAISSSGKGELDRLFNEQAEDEDD